MTTLTLAYRNLAQLRHSPAAIIGTVVFPLGFVLLFGFVFGSAIPVGANYREYLLPGLFVLTIVLGSAGSLIVVAADGERGVTDRLRSLPIGRSAVPSGQTLADLVVAAGTLAIMLVAGLAVGWRIRNGLLPFLAAVGLLLLLQYAMSWVAVYIGTFARDERAAAKFGPILMPVTIVSNVFVPTDNMPSVLRLIAEWNPVSAVAAAVRTLFGNPGVPAGPGLPWPLAHPVVAALAWCLVLLAMFVPLAVRRFVRNP